MLHLTGNGDLREEVQEGSGRGAGGMGGVAVEICRNMMQHVH